jgi:hypothetical protein
VAFASPAFRSLAARSGRELETILQRGRAPAIDALLGYEYRGFNHPRRSALLGIRSFLKGFFAAGDEAFGFNARARQNGLDGEWLAKPDDAHPRPFAFFGVAAVRPGERDSAYPHAVLLDYAAGRNAVYDPARLVRDYLVRVEEDSDDLLLGKAYLAVGPARVRVGFFLLERHRPFVIGPELERRVRDGVSRRGRP